MAHKDYVARGRNPKKAPEPEKRPLPWSVSYTHLTLPTIYSV